MKKPKKITILLSASMLICSNVSVLAQEKRVELKDLAPKETQEIIDTLKACDVAQEKCKKAQEDKDKVINNQDEQITVQRKRIEELERKDTSILENKTLWFILGSIFTGVVYRLTR